MKKHNLFVVVLLIWALMLSGCKDDKEATATSVADSSPMPMPEPTSPPEKEPGTYYWLAANNSNSFYHPGLQGWNAAAEELNVNVEFVGPEEPNLAEQISTFEALIANPDTKGVFFYAMDFNAGEPMVIEAQENGIPVIYGNTDSPFKTRVGFVGTESKIMGQQAASYAESLIGCDDVSVAGLGNNGAVVPQRLQYFLDAFQELCPDATIMELGLNDGSLQGSISLLESYTIANPDVTLIWWGDGAAGQLVEVWKEIVDNGSKTLFLGTDMQQPALEAVRDGDWVGTIGQDTFAEEYWGLKFLVAYNKGLAIPDSTLLSTMIITPDNVDQYLP